MNALITNRRGSQQSADTGWKPLMKRIPSVLVLAVVAVFGQIPSSAVAADEDGVALAIVYDTSGSMSDPVRDSAGASSPKYVIANRALLAVARQIQAFVTNNPSGGSRKIDTALFVFEGNQAREVVPLHPFDAAALEKFANSFSNPHGGTPLGNTVKTAAEAVLASKQP